MGVQMPRPYGLSVVAQPVYSKGYLRGRLVEARNEPMCLPLSTQPPAPEKTAQLANAACHAAGAGAIFYRSCYGF
ncbi:hypothetical protein GUJ93_ZPchr0006g42080 [Zizania palustris]|uniref:Uncharacterized protein n=1 Tax=Zizania palustris TaxID=103762 RepID=A0A8J5SGI6_ZIZPA|nr:hypothetical protein GUJ93_ZPchr0006g42080 [Zizania palustris]